ncbi:hypothetical protein [Pseudoalteromonas sp. T1lg75]|uniref:hypothetical protein n=1 Tax=Pseudoalteromonas sp. T1lg75 TaxID=2077102 RepID=UPI001319BF53|nr:hypothetical protein [Pseudoalteromonas sp. T1lg75]
MNKQRIALALLSSIFIQLPLGYFFISLESLVLGHGFIGAPDGIGFYLLMNLLIATTVIIIIGLPVYLILQRLNSNTTFKVSLVGFLIPVIILCIIYLTNSDYSGYSAGENYYGTYRKTFIDGKRTFWGWVKVFESLVTYGVHGIVGAIVFHKIQTRGNNA